MLIMLPVYITNLLEIHDNVRCNLLGLRLNGIRMLYIYHVV